MCDNILDVATDRRADAFAAALSRGWESQGGDLFICDSCACVLTLCPVCKTTKYRYGIDGTCSAFCAARKEETAINDETASIIAVLQRGLD